MTVDEYSSKHDWNIKSSEFRLPLDKAIDWTMYVQMLVPFRLRHSIFMDLEQ